MKKFKSIYIVAPGNSVTGGPELLHQLASSLQKNGHQVFICYYPLNGQFKCPEQYLKYKTNQGVIEDSSENLLIVPEVLTGLVLKYKKINTAVWWLSVDNYKYQGALGIVWFRKKVLNALDILSGKRVCFISALKNSEHFCQSYYAKVYLEQYRFMPSMLSDYLSKEHFQASTSPVKLDQIAYNPRKGYRTTLRLIKANPEFKFVPIVGLSPDGVRELLQSSKIYIDFGHHPGKDRVPREAALAGCCVITGRQGAANNDQDVSIPEIFRLNELDRDFIGKFRKLVEMIYSDFYTNSKSYTKYIDSIRNEKELFEQQVRKIFG